MRLRQNQQMQIQISKLPKCPELTLEMCLAAGINCGI